MIQSIASGVAAAASPQGKSGTTKTTITPFEKVLEDTTEATATADTTSNAVTTTTSKTASSTSSDSSGTTTLKDIFKRASEKYNVPYDFLVAVAKAESSFNLDSTSHAGAQGIMQLMPATAKELGVTDAYDPEQNIMAGAKYLGAHLKAFNNDQKLAAAAYNAGGAAVRKYDGIPPYEETQNYVKTIMKFMKEGVTVPDKTVISSSVGKEGSAETSTSSSKTSSKSTSQAATDRELQATTVVVGTGDQAVTMTYSAYKRYLELGTTGVG